MSISGLAAILLSHSYKILRFLEHVHLSCVLDTYLNLCLSKFVEIRPMPAPQSRTLPLLKSVFLKDTRSKNDYEFWMSIGFSSALPIMTP